MKRYTYSAIILIAALALAGCSKTEEFLYNPDSALQIESVSGISPFALMQEPASKAVITGETLLGDEAAKGIGLFVTAQGGGAYDGKTTGYSNVKYAYSSEKWSAASPIYLSNTTGKLYAYFPYSADANNLTAIPVESSLDGTDYLYATSQDVSFSNKSVNLQMNHALARLHLTIKKGDKYLSDCNLSKIVLQSKAIDTSGTMDITIGAVTATKAVDATGTFTLTGSDAVTASGITKDILLVPASAAEGKKDLTLTLTIDGVDAEVKFTADKGLDIRSGIQNNVSIIIEDTGIKVTGIGVGTWGEGGSQTVQVSGHTVTVKLSDDIPVGNVPLSIYVEGLSVKIIAFPIVSRGLICNISGSANCDRIRDYRDVHTFTISEIQSDITATIESAPLPPGALPGVFTVSNYDGQITKRIYFSQGNLWYGKVGDAQTATFNFEANQYSFASSWDASHVSHFYWSQSVNSAIAGVYDWNRSDSDVFFTNETETTAKASFTVNVGGTEQTGWRTLSTKEWQYLFNTRTMKNGKDRYTLNITYGGKMGLVLYPDDYDNDPISGSVETMPEGVVFLPAAGYRSGFNFGLVGDRGHYWSTTEYYEGAYYVYFFSSHVYPDFAGSCGIGCSVRLITE